MLTARSVREAPAPPLEQPAADCPDPSRPPVPGERVLEMKQIQGNIVVGFNKDFQTLLLLEITDAADFKRWLAALVPFIASASEVLAFNRLFKEIRRRRGRFADHPGHLDQYRALLPRADAAGRRRVQLRRREL